MTMLQGLSLKGKIYSSSGLTLILMAAIGYAGFMGLTQMHDSELEMNHKWLPALQMSGKIDSKISDLRRLQIRYIFANNEKERETYGEKLKTALADIGKIRKDLDVFKFEGDKAKQLQKFDASLAAYLNITREIEALPMISTIEEATERLEKTKNKYEELKTETDDFTVLVVKQTDTMAELAENDFTKSRTYIVSLFLICSFISGATSMAIVRAIANPLKKITERLTENSQSLSRATDELASSALAVSSSTSEQAAAIQETIASMSEMASTLTQTSQSTETVSRNTREVTQTSQDGIAVMTSVVTSMEDIEKSNADLALVSQIIEDIRAKTNIINDIVFKTQLLSFNASIEAARAGQHGRGFAVVAEEVGTLAQLSGQASKEISSLLQNSRESVAKIVGDMRSKVETGKKVSSEALSQFQKISQSIESISSQVESIAQASKEQQIGVQQTTVAMSQLDTTAQSNAAAAQRTSSVAKDIKETGVNMDEAAENLQGLLNGIAV